MSFFNCTNPIDAQNSYFAAANTKDGFVSFFDVIYKSIPKIYVIKGGPGTGKSTLMQKIAVEGENRGFEVQKYYCSSDSSSLDGVIVGGKFAVIDATSPHPMEPRCVGAMDEVINLCDMPDQNILENNKEEIAHLSHEISFRYKGVYKLQRSMSALEDQYLSIVEQHINKEKLKRFCEKSVSSLHGSKDISLKLCDAVGVHGSIHLRSLEKDTKKVIYLGGKYHEGEILLRYIKNSLDKAGIGYEFSLFPSSLTPCAVRVGCETTFVCAEQPSCELKYLNTQRFLYPTIKEQKSKLKHLEKLCMDISELICAELSIIGKLHDELENYYKSAMDYEKLDRLTKKLLIKMFCQN